MSDPRYERGVLHASKSLIDDLVSSPWVDTALLMTERMKAALQRFPDETDPTLKALDAVAPKALPRVFSGEVGALYGVRVVTSKAVPPGTMFMMGTKVRLGGP